MVPWLQIIQIAHRSFLWISSNAVKCIIQFYNIMDFVYFVIVLIQIWASKCCQMPSVVTQIVLRWHRRCSVGEVWIVTQQQVTVCLSLVQRWTLFPRKVLNFQKIRSQTFQNMLALKENHYQHPFWTISHDSKESSPKVSLMCGGCMMMEVHCYKLNVGSFNLFLHNSVTSMYHFFSGKQFPLSMETF